jgi:HEAT repeat protein
MNPLWTGLVVAAALGVLLRWWWRARLVRNAIRGLGDLHSKARLDAALFLGDIGKRAAPATPDLTRALTDQSAEVRAAAASALGMIGPLAVDAVPALCDALVDGDDAFIRSVSAWALVLIEDATPEAIDFMARRLAEGEEEERDDMASVLGFFGERAVARVLPHLEHAEPEVRVAAAGVLEDVGEPSSAAPVADRLAREPVEDVRVALVEALGEMGTEAEAALELAQEDPSPAVSRAAQRALAVIREDWDLVVKLDDEQGDGAAAP